MFSEKHSLAGMAYTQNKCLSPKPQSDWCLWLSSLLPGQESLCSGASPFRGSYTLPGLWHHSGWALAKGSLKGAGLQENTVVLAHYCQHRLYYQSAVGGDLQPLGTQVGKVGGGDTHGVCEVCVGGDLEPRPGLRERSAEFRGRACH